MALCHARNANISKGIAVIGSCISFILVWGVSYSPGVYFPIFITVFGESRAKTAWVGSIMMAWSFFSSPISSLLVNRFGCRVTVILAGLLTATGLAISSQAQSLYVQYLTYGFMAGAGCGMLYVPNFVIIAEHFDERSASLFYGVTAGVGGLGSFIFPPMIRFLEDVYGWRGSLLICAGLSLNIGLAGTMMQPGNKLKVHTDKDDKARSENELKIGTDGEQCDQVDILDDESSEIELSPLHYREEEERLGNCVIKSRDGHRNWKARLHLDDLVILKSISYLVFCMQQTLCFFGTSMIFVHLGAHTELSLNIGRIESSLLYSVIGIALLISKITWGFLLRLNAVQERVMLLYTLTLSVSGLSTLFLPLIIPYFSLVIYSFLFGFGYSALGGAHISCTIIQMTGVEKLSLAYGIVLFFEGVGQIFGPPLSGWIYDYFRSYHDSFLVSGSFIMASCLIMAIPLWRQRGKKRKCTEIEILTEKEISL